MQGVRCEVCVCVCVCVCVRACVPVCVQKERGYGRGSSVHVRALMRVCLSLGWLHAAAQHNLRLSSLKTPLGPGRGRTRSAST